MMSPGSQKRLTPGNRTHATISKIVRTTQRILLTGPGTSPIHCTGRRRLEVTKPGSRSGVVRLVISNMTVKTIPTRNTTRAISPRGKTKGGTSNLRVTKLADANEASAMGDYSFITFSNFPLPKFWRSARRNVLHNSTGKDERFLRMTGNLGHDNGPSL